jgi:polyvinyl alcohol dehydrogenase (cytochrome)
VSTSQVRVALGLSLCILLSMQRSEATDRGGGAALYQQRCAACHDYPREQIPPKAVLSAKPREHIVQVLTSGPMQPMASGLTRAQINSVAAYLVSSAPAGQIRLESPDLEADLCRDPAPQLRPATGDWNGWSPDLENSRLQPQPELKVDDIARLKPKWVFAYPGSQVLGPPSVVGGRVYVGTDTGSVLSLDAATGCTYWATKPGLFAKSAVTVAPFGKGAGPAFVAYFSGSNGNRPCRRC